MYINPLANPIFALMTNATVIAGLIWLVYSWTITQMYQVCKFIDREIKTYPDVFLELSDRDQDMNHAAAPATAMHRIPGN